MKDLLFHVDDSGSLHPMEVTPYEREDDLQALLANNPQILSVIDEELRGFLLVRREMGVPDAEGAGARWSVDHLFLDSDGVPTLVETKRSSDTRLRREVVGQLLDYAANGLTNWPPGELRSQFVRRCQAAGTDPDEALAQFLGEGEGDVAEVADRFWQQVAARLQAEQLRLVFVADVIPRELQRVIEYLNSHMPDTEVVGLELKQFYADGRRTLVPRVVGRTAKAQQRKAVERGRPSQTWEEETFLAALEATSGAAARRIATEILRWCESRGLHIHWSGKETGTFTPILRHGGAAHRIVKISMEGEVRTQFNLERRLPPFTDPELRRELLRRLNESPGVALPEAAIDGKKHGFSLRVLEDQEAMGRFLSVLDWFLETIRGRRM